MATGTLRVTPEKLRSTSGQFEQSNTKVSTLTQQMTDIAKELSSTWGGEAAQMYYSKLNGLNGDIQKLTRMITEHINDLNSIAQQYENAEKNNLSTASALGTSGIA